MKQVNTAQSPLRERLSQVYNVKKVSAELDPLQITFWPPDRKAVSHLIECCNTGELSELIHDNIDITGVSKAWEVTLRPDVSNLKQLMALDGGLPRDSGFVSGLLPNGSDSVPHQPHGGPAESLPTVMCALNLTADSCEDQETDSPDGRDLVDYAGPLNANLDFSLSKPPHHSLMEPLRSAKNSPLPQALLQSFNPLLLLPDQIHSPRMSEIDFSHKLCNTIKRKQTTAYDLIQLLRSNKDRFDISKVQDEDGNHVLHMCIIYKKFAFLVVIFCMELLGSLIDQKIPMGAASEFAGFTPRDVTERKRMRRYIRELDSLRQQEEDLQEKTPALKDCRSGVYDKIRNHSSEDLRAVDSERRTAIHWACINGSLNVLEYLVKMQCKANSSNSNGETPLHMPYSLGNLPWSTILVSTCGLDPFAKNKSGKTPLHIASENGDKDCLFELLRCGVPLEKDLVLIASQHGRCEYLRLLITTHGLDPHHKEASTGKTCLMAAAENDHVETVRFLLEKFTFQLDDLTTQARNIFHLVAEKGNTETAKLLLEHAKRKNYDVTKLLDQKDKHRPEQRCTIVRGIDKGRPAWHYVLLQRRSVHLSQKCIQNGRIDVNRWELSSGRVGGRTSM